MPDGQVVDENSNDTKQSLKRAKSLDFAATTALLYRNGNVDTGERCKRPLFKWSPTSERLLSEAEKGILSYLKTPYEEQFVNIGPVIGKKDCRIRTVSLNANRTDKVPLVIVHGLCSGIGLWILNLEGLAAERPVYAIDLIGFGRSSRPKFSQDALEAESEHVRAIEEWRKTMNLERFVLLGHSMGGFLATSYALQFPERVSHLILADPWGYSEKPADPTEKYPVSIWVKVMIHVVKPLNPLWGLRAMGPMGPRFIRRARPDLTSKFSVLGEDANEKIADYIYHSNTQTPSGEDAFHSMMKYFAWAKHPMIKRIGSMDKSVPMTLIYGTKSWLDHCSEEMIKEMRPDSFVDVQTMEGAGHHLYADDKDKFNELVLNSCSNVD